MLMKGRLAGARALKLSLIIAAAVLALSSLTASAFSGKSLENKAASTDESAVGVWVANLPNGLRVATITIVPSGDGVAGAFMGYDYDRPVADKDGKPIEGAAPKVAHRTGSLMIDPKLEGNTLTFKLAPKGPQGRTLDIAAEIKLMDANSAELKMKVGSRPEPITLKLTRE